VKPRSLVFDIFGDYICYRGGEIRLRGLTALLACFDIPEPTVRVVVGRLRRDGWLTSRRDGRETIYALSDASWELLAEGRDRIFQRAPVVWPGKWHMIIYSVPELQRGLRERLRKRLAWMGFGPLSSSVWISPHDRTAAVLATFSDNRAIHLDVFESQSRSESANFDLAARAWDLETLNNDYGRWLTANQPQLASYRNNELRGTPALVERMRLINSYRHFPFRDPDLPVELLPGHWLGGQAHSLFIEAHSLLATPAQAAVDELLQ
jgi:phenylacetic acid degradation operon negative regulatory protein